MNNISRIMIILWLSAFAAYLVSGSYLNDLALELPLFAWNDYMFANIIFDADEWRQAIITTNIHEELNMMVADQLVDQED